MHILSFLGKHRSGLPHCLRMFGRMNGRSEEEWGSVRAVREADDCVPSERKFWKTKQGWRGYLKSTENSSSWKCSALLKPSPSKRFLAIRYFLQDMEDFLFFNILVIVCHIGVCLKLTDELMSTLIPVETEFLNKGNYRTKKTFDVIRSNYIGIHESR